MENTGIYKITNTVNGKFYIGSSNDIKHRWNEHKSKLKSNRHINTKLQNAWNFYGEDKFLFEVVESTDNNQSILFEREQHYLDLFKPYMRDIGYNICPKAAGGDTITHNPNREQFVQKMSTLCTGENNPMFGKTHTSDSIALQKEKSKGKFTLDWFIQKYGEVDGKTKYEDRRNKLLNRKINYSYSNGFEGKKRSFMNDTVKTKISENKLRLKELKPKIFSDIQSGQYTINQIAEKYQISATSVKYYKRKLS
jgi:group I intron endonuclease